MNQSYLAAIKSFEGFTPQAKWDYAQHSNGYGTKALYPGEAITAEEAEKRFAAEIAVARDIVDKHAQGWDEGTKAALTSLTFNAGTRWISSGLGDAVRNKDIEGVRERFVQYTKAQGEELPGLVKRRLAELDWIGGGTQAAAQAAAPVATPATPRLQAAVARPASNLQAVLQPALDTGPITIGRLSDVAPPAATDRREVALALQDHLAGLSPGEVTDARHAQTLSMLMTLLFDLQMRAAASKPRDGGDPTTSQPQQPQHSI